MQLSIGGFFAENLISVNDFLITILLFLLVFRIFGLQEGYNGQDQF